MDPPFCKYVPHAIENVIVARPWPKRARTCERSIFTLGWPRPGQGQAKGRGQ